MLIKIFNKIRKLKGRFFFKNKSFEKEKEKVLIMIFNPKINFRTILNLSYHLYEKGLVTYLFSISPKHYINYLELGESQRYIKFFPFFPVGKIQIFTDSSKLSELFKNIKLIKPITSAKQYSLPNAIPYFPYPDSLIAFGQYDLKRKRAPNKPYVITFFGNHRSPEYGKFDSFLMDKFNVVGRQSTVKYLFEKYDDQEVFYHQGIRKIQLRDNLVLKINYNVFKIDPQRYLNELTDSDFFLSLPGVIMPLTHSIIEASLLGNIPVVNYNSYFSNKLDDTNSLKYDSFESLEEVFDQIDQMQPSEVFGKKIKLIQSIHEYLDFDFSNQKEFLITNENLDMLKKFEA
ncbi:hypothetical protein [Algoriphagus hitonicola]|uniref:Uncharacterized protein n=1 Tax=Algoriphagus hitonicola TaxID=435880 RepID=A0A1I2X3N0_9BACT|nr:hypothetical protein [Algoriphagus hitonicola]SFH08042.1 hypothetical protein SAMN04487988_11615 [Algoriphagus hitonicola]